MKKNIPKSFTLNGKTIIVEFDNEYCNEMDYWGEADFEDKVITLCSEFKGKTLDNYTIETTFYHELAHLLLDACGQHKLKFNEKFVDKLGMAVYEFINTRK